MFIYIFIFIIFIALISTYTGGADHVKNQLYNSILTQLSQYPAQRVNLYLKVNNIKDIIKKKGITTVAEFFESEKINSSTFYTGLQTEILNQNPQKRLSADALLLSDFELLETYKSSNIFI